MSERNTLREELYSVWVWYADDFHLKELEGVDAETAVRKAQSLTLNVGARLGIVRKIQIVSELDDSTAFLWEHGKGVTFPPRDESGHFMEVK